MSIAFMFPGQGSQAVGMGKALAGAFRGRTRRVRRGRRRRSASKLSTDHVGGPGRDADAHRERAAGADGGVARGHARAGGARPGSISCATRSSSPAIRSANIRRSPPPARFRSPIPRACCASAARPCRRRCRSASAPWRRCSALDFDAAAAVAAEAAQGQVCEVANDNGARPGRGLRRQGRGRARGRDRQGARAPSAPCCCRCPRPSIAR